MMDYELLTPDAEYAEAWQRHRTLCLRYVRLCATACTRGTTIKACEELNAVRQEMKALAQEYEL